MDSEILLRLLEAIGLKRNITLGSVNRKKDRITENHVVPLKIFLSVQSDRQYLMAYAPRLDRIISYRVDNIVSVRNDDVSDHFDELREILEKMQAHIWGVSTNSRSGHRMEHIEFTVRYRGYESYIHQRLEREKRCGTVEQLDPNTSRKRKRPEVRTEGKHLWNGCGSEAGKSERKRTAKLSTGTWKEGMRD